jgi:AcrR family transcriptional regulator
MARTRSFSSEQVVEAAQGVFWRRGCQQAAIGDLERAIRLSRSSLYGAFGTKKAIFDQALDAYLAGFVGSRLARWNGRRPTPATSSGSSPGWRRSSAPTSAPGRDAS